MKHLKLYTHILLPVIIISLLLAPSCIKRKYRVLEVTPALLERYNYKPGSYWIMRDSATGRTDSFYITSSTTTNYTRRAGLDVQNIVGQMQQLSADKADTFFWEWRYIQSDLTLKLQSKANRDVLYPCGFMKYPLTITYTSFPLNSRYYADVNESNMTDDSAFQYNNRLFLNEADGLVKVRLNHPSDSQHFVWELVRRNIVL